MVYRTENGMFALDVQARESGRNRSLARNSSTDVLSLCFHIRFSPHSLHAYSLSNGKQNPFLKKLINYFGIFSGTGAKVLEFH